MAVDVFSEISDNFRDKTEFCFQRFSTLFHSKNTEWKKKDNARMRTP
jgi:hypothetical protein